MVVLSMEMGSFVDIEDKMALLSMDTGVFVDGKLCLRSMAIKKAVFLAEKGKMGTLSKNWAVFLAGKVQTPISMDGVVQNRVVCPPKAGFSWTAGDHLVKF